MKIIVGFIKIKIHFLNGQLGNVVSVWMIVTQSLNVVENVQDLFGVFNPRFYFIY
jgi:hypothetical protein